MTNLDVVCDICKYPMQEHDDKTIGICQDCETDLEKEHAEWIEELEEYMLSIRLGGLR